MVVRLRKLLGALGLVVIVACGGGAAPKGAEGEPVEEEEGRGNLAVQIKKVSSSDVRSIWIELLPDPQPGEYPDNVPVRFPLFEQGGTWSGFGTDIFLGTYSVTAYAFDRVVGEQAFILDQGNVRSEALFRSHAQSVRIQHNQTTALFLLLHEQTEPGVLEMPRFVAVHFDRAVVEQWEKLLITVEAEPGAGTLGTLIGRFHEGATPGTDPGQAGLFEGPGDFAGGTIAQIVWVPPREQGPKFFVLRIENDAGQVVELGVEVEVGTDIGDVQILFELNEAPEMVVDEMRVLNGSTGTEVSLWIDFDDEEGEDVSYQWTDDCGPEFVWTAGESGTVPTPSLRVYAELIDDTRSAASRDRDPDASCTITLEAQDERGARRRLHIEILTGWLEPEEP